MNIPSMPDSAWALALWTLAVIVALILMWAARSQRSINGHVSAIAAVIAAVFLVLGVQAARYQVVQQEEFAGRTGIDPVTAEVISNPRLVRDEINVDRGTIYSADGSRLAWSEETADGFVRRFGDPLLSSLTGYFSPLLYGKNGLEAALDDELRGASGRSAIQEIAGAIGLGKSGPLDVYLTIDSMLQARAQELLGSQTGAAIVIDVDTGAVVAMASSPIIDPALLAATTEDQVEPARAYWRALVDDEARPFVRRSTDGLYPPGSTFKLVTAAAVLDSGLATAGTVYQDDGTFDVEGHTIVEPNRPDESVTEWTLADGLAFSLNVVFAQAGLQLGAQELSEYASRFGIGEEIPFELQVAVGQVAGSEDFLDAQAALADTAFGQGELLVTPLHLALVAAAIANDGVMMTPYLVGSLAEQDGATVDSTDPAIWKTPISPQAARQVQEMMVGAVEYGYAGAAAIPGYRVGGKTGTAESGTDLPHGWFVGFAGDGDPEFAVAIVLEHGGEGGGAPARIGAELLSLALESIP